MFRMTSSEALRYEALNLSPEQLLPVVAEYFLRLDVDHHNLTLCGCRHDGIGRRFEQTSKAVVHPLTIRVRNLHCPRKPSTGLSWSSVASSSVVGPQTWAYYKPALTPANMRMARSHYVSLGEV